MEIPQNLWYAKWLKNFSPGTVARAFNPSTWNAEASLGYGVGSRTARKDSTENNCLKKQ